jgi:hypothetical protein
MPTSMLTPKDVTVAKIVPSGAYACSALVDDHLMQRQYMQYTKREAIRLFCDEANATEA